MSERNARAVDVAVIGGGVIGLAIAWRVCQRGLGVVLLDRGAPGWGTSRMAAGMLAPIAETTPGEEPLLHLGLAGVRLYDDFVRDLSAAAGGLEIGHTRCGTLLVARDADEAEALERELTLRQRYGLAVQRLRASEARRREPALAPALRLALDVPDDHAVDPRRLSAALVAAVTRAGGQIRADTEVAALEIVDGTVRGLTLAGGQRLAARQVVVAAGVWSGGLEGVPPGARIPLRPVKGQIMRLHDPSGPGLLTRVIRMGSSYVVPRGDGRYVIGATSEERGFDTTVTAGAAFELLRDASELVPGVSELLLDEFSAGLRPATPDNLPVIGPSSIAGLHWATGHRRGGILLAPITAELIVRSLIGEDPGPLAPAFAPARFAPGSARSRG